MIRQLPVNKWYEIIGDNTLANAILERVDHNSHRLELSGESMRKVMAGMEKPRVLKSVSREKKKDFYCPFILGTGVPLSWNKQLVHLSLGYMSIRTKI